MNEAPVKQAEERRPDWAALAIAAVLVVIALVIFLDASRLREMMGYSPVGPASVPMAIAGALVVLAIWTVFAGFRGDFPKREHQEIAPVAWIVGGLAAQMLLLTTAGFSIATGMLFALTAAGFGKRKFWISIPLGIVISFVVWAVFSQLLKLSLPAGPLEQLFF
ncbi:tripartite tricarboxylate transporter TctB family protein [Pararhizobium antarcticum]|uniref:C4-dicarboxylate ABC transporter n=1 Tax=Pararhizobium antarcticum TaxID=1798805 RepID=A0A657LQY2_9HYPH|nr:tripartite tricarboxylate transporter TctB family protein [Pararhizobium antarcticum]OJF91295.1 C4-dicarboxylate ABC transporter [Pararhizobium antarcticum]OJG01202.1 C4-dicarboxylate ABC transporter [Rhizobium sp. 58]